MLRGRILAALAGLAVCACAGDESGGSSGSRREYTCTWQAFCPGAWSPLQTAGPYCAASAGEAADELGLECGPTCSCPVKCTPTGDGC